MLPSGKQARVTNRVAWAITHLSGPVRNMLYPISSPSQITQATNRRQKRVLVLRNVHQALRPDNLPVVCQRLLSETQLDALLGPYRIYDGWRRTRFLCDRASYLCSAKRWYLGCPNRILRQRRSRQEYAGTMSSHTSRVRCESTDGPAPRATESPQPLQHVHRTETPHRPRPAPPGTPSTSPWKSPNTGLPTSACTVTPQAAPWH
jgi:hypothetical protein